MRARSCGSLHRYEGPTDHSPSHSTRSTTSSCSSVIRAYTGSHSIVCAWTPLDSRLAWDATDEWAQELRLVFPFVARLRQALLARLSESIVTAPT